MSRGYLLAVGFGTSVVMWGSGYLARLPGSVVPGWLLAGWFALALVLGGAVAGRLSGAGWRGGLGAMVVTSLVNLLLVGSLVRVDAQDDIARRAFLWVGGTLVAGAALGALGGVLGGRRGTGSSHAVNWNNALAWVAVAATVMLLVVGGVVTSNDAGLAVTDWPNSYGYNMFLYPLARMTGPIYLEHAHRLFGSLVGLTTLVLAIRLAVTERRARIKAFAFSLLVLVIAQGILGGLRVTGRLTMSQSPDETAPSLALAVVHGVMAQLFLGCMVALAVMTTDAWQGPGSRRSPDAGGGEPRGAAGERVRGTVGDARLAMVLVVVLFMQLVLGALQRHFARGLSIHLMLAGMVAILAYAAGARAWGKGEREPVLARIGITLVVVTTLQIALGFGALTTTGALLGTPVITMASVLFATAHQTMGAALLALAVALLVWSAQPLNARPPGSVPPASPPRPLPAGAHRAT